MTFTTLALAIFVLLITPGPTNTLLFLAGTERGWRGAAGLIPFELAGYLLMVVPLALAGAAWLHHAPHLRAVVAVLAGLWVGWLAIKLLLPQPARRDPRPIGAAEVFLTTLLNPKALIFGLVLLPSPVHLATNLALFAGQVALVACGWAGLGAWLGGAAGARPAVLAWVRRAASLWLTLVSVLLLAKGLGAA